MQFGLDPQYLRKNELNLDIVSLYSLDQFKFQRILTLYVRGYVHPGGWRCQVLMDLPASTYYCINRFIGYGPAYII